MRLAAALWPFRFARGYVSEGRRWLDSAVSRSGSAANLARAKALNEAGWLAMFQDEYGAAKALIEEGLAFYRQLGDKEGIASSIAYLGFVAVLGQRDDIPVATLLEEAKGLKPELRDRRTIAYLLVLEGLITLGQGDLEQAVALNEEALALYREVSDALGVVACLTNIGLVKLAQGDYERSAKLLREGLRLARGLDHKLYIQYSIIGLAGVAASRVRPVRAIEFHQSSKAVPKEREKGGTRNDGTSRKRRARSEHAAERCGTTRDVGRFEHAFTTRSSGGYRPLVGAPH
jgi:tetratricopeptide (TPR) repeat protein